MTRSEQALAILSKLEAAPTVARCMDLYLQAVEPFGVAVFRGSPMPGAPGPRIPAAVATNWSEAWTRHYFGERAWRFDPTLLALRGERQSFYWRELPPAETPEGRALMREAAALGMADGFVTVRRSPGELMTAFYVAGRSLEWSALEQGVVSFVSHSMLSRCLTLKEISLAPAVQSLSEREAEVLQRAARGWSDKEIAQDLEIGFGTVRFHWASIRRKLGAVDRANAVAVGLWSGQIVP